MSTNTATRAASIKRRLDQLGRRAAIRSEGLQYSGEVMQRFGVSNPTAVADLRSVYGELPRKSVTLTPVSNPREPKGVHCGLRMSERTFEILQAGAAALGLTESEAIRYAIIVTFASAEKEHA